MMYHANRMLTDHARQLTEERLRLFRQGRIAEAAAHQPGFRARLARLLIASAGMLEADPGDTPTAAAPR